MNTILSWSQWSMRNPKLAIVLFLLVAILAGVGAKNLYFRGDYKVFFEPDDPQRVTFEDMQNTFSKSENVSFLVVPNSGSVYAPKTFQLLSELTEQAWQVPLSTRVESLANYQHTYSEQDDLIVVDLIDAMILDQIEPDYVREVAESLPEVLGRLVSKQGDAALVNVTVQLPDGDQTKEVMEITERVELIKQDFKTRYPDHTIYLTGVVMMTEAFVSSAQHDAQTLTPLMFFVILLMIGLLTHSFYYALAAFLIVVTSIVFTMGLAGWMGYFMSTATVNVPTVVTTLAVADCIHIILGTRQFISKGLNKFDAITESLLLNIKPVIITSVTTAIGFLMLNFAKVPILADLGNLTAIGVSFACLASLIVLPALLMLLPSSVSANDARKDELFASFGDAVVKRYRTLLPISLSVFVLVSMLSANNVINDIVTDYFKDDNTFKHAVDVQGSYMGGMSNVDFVIDSDSEYGVAAPQLLATLDVFSSWLREQPEVHHVLNFSDTMKRLNQNMNNDDAQFYAIPDDQQLASQYLLLYEMSLPFGLDLNNQLNNDKSKVRLIVTLEDLGSNEFIDFEKRAANFFAQLNSGYQMNAASPPLMFAHIGERNMHSMLWGTLIALVLISLLIVFALRSWRLGMVSLFTNLLPAGVGFGIWSLISGEINMGLSVVLSMTLGIIVDDTVHFLAKYKYAKEKGKCTFDSVHYAFKTVGMAIATTTLVLAAGFGVLMFSDFVLNSAMGQLTVIIIILALLIDLVFLPPFLLWWDKDDMTDKKVAKLKEAKNES